MTIQQIEFIDEVLFELEDDTRGELGDKITDCRTILNDFKRKLENGYLTIIEKEKLKDLIADKMFLSNLKAVGIDNWEGYDLTDYPSQNEIDGYFNTLIKK